ncbi:Retrovirus-related Pol polyprotein from transposon TNT 1-94 [Quillaja saponaria]|uniref:Retrovirus-related Pol polyprotein from transposon TNT 1-94 n=1 Tax=Quillaja saponaria TaxID=32244 RepID=A0AAD7LR10_QUISA|nr:Retrovirus-related Pol polyprotein from transposon TNT 1-94 [Quillaja saponaria]
MFTYLGKIQNIKAELAEILPLTTDLADQEAQRDKLFMILTLYGLRADLDPVRHQILASPSIPSMEEVFARLLRISSPDGSYQGKVLPTDWLSGPLLTLGFLILVPLITYMDRRTGRTIGTGRESHGLYHLTTLPTSSVACSTDVSPILIHSRLGHPSLSKLQKMVPRLSHLSSLNCESCQLGKHTRVSFPKHSRFRAESHFHLVHTDVWGPSRVSSSLGFQYFVTFIDDYSSCTWLFLMKNRSELFSIFQQFCVEIKTQFGVSIRILRSDNSREYFSTSFQHFMTSQGMLHQSSCSHTPQQNGVAERKNRHLIETARTLLLHGHVPLRFWGDAVLTACYLINRMPSSTLHNKIPYSIIFPNHPLYSLPLDKNRYFISADVTFFEESSFFPSTIPELPSISEALPVPYLGPNDCISSAPLPDLLADTVDVPDDSPSVLTPSRASDLASPPILRRGTCSTRNPYPIYTFLSYHRLSSPYYAFVSFLSSISVPKSTSDALAHPGWRQAIIDEMNALHTNGTWELVSLLSRKSTVGCKWVYTVKVHPDSSVDRLKARLVAKGYTQSRFTMLG